MKPPAVLVIVVLLLSSCGKSDVSPMAQLPFANADMESGTTRPTAWINNSQTSPEIKMTWATHESSSPSHSLEMSRSTITDTNSFAFWGHYYQLAMPVGKDLTFSIKIKGENLVGQGVSIALSIDGTTQGMQYSTTQGNLLINGTFNWKTYTIKLENVSSEANTILVLLNYLPNTTGKAYFDDASLSHN